MFFGAIFWDPNPDIFILPYIDHPVKWYGFFFVSGMIAGFFLLYHLLIEKLAGVDKLQERDIADWDDLRKAIVRTKPDDASNPLSALTIDKSTIKQLQSPAELSDSTKRSLLSSLSGIDRRKLEELLPSAIVPLKEISYKYVDTLMWWFVIGTIIGARLGHVFFYAWDYYRHHLLSIFKIWEGGLASHGGTAGILLVIYFYTRWTRKKFPELNFLALLDLLAIPVAYGVIFIRIGNFINQEITGTPSNLPWAVIFGHPLEGGAPIPRHPVQLYEAGAYLLTFILLTTLWNLKKGKWAEGFMIGLLFVCIFGSRFFLEFFKSSQTSFLPGESYLEVGQLLSIPFIFLGVALIYFSRTRRNHDYCKR